MQGVYGAGAHTDYGALTVLATDDSPGLQINTDGQWQHVKPIPNTFIINLGDMLERHVSFLRPYALNAVCKCALVIHSGDMFESSSVELTEHGDNSCTTLLLWCRVEGGPGGGRGGGL